LGAVRIAGRFGERDDVADDRFHLVLASIFRESCGGGDWPPVWDAWRVDTPCRVGGGHERLVLWGLVDRVGLVDGGWPRRSPPKGERSFGSLDRRAYR
jgi:hypothetical protein